jgi:hypothetical protein
MFPKRSGSAIVMEKLLGHFDSGSMVALGELTPFAKPIHRASDRPKFTYCRTRLSFWGRGARFLSKVRWQFLALVISKIVRTARREQCEAILGVYPDEMYLYAAYLASQELQLPFFSYFHNTYLDNIAVDRKRAEAIQEEVFRASRRVFVMSEGMKRYFEQQYGLANCRALVHTFEEYPREEPSPYQLPKGRPVKVMLLGNFNESNRDATVRLCNTLKSMSEVKIHIYSDVPRFLLEKRGLPMNSIEYHGSLGHLPFGDLIDEIRKFDILALTHGFTGGYGEVEYRTIFPTRTIPLLLAGRPLLVHSPDGSFLTEFAEENEIGQVVKTRSEGDLRNAMELLLSDRTRVEHSILHSRRAADQFFGVYVANVLRSELRQGLIECSAES